MREMAGLRKGREVIGLPVVSLTTGKELGSVEDLLWDHHGRKITCLVVGGRRNSKESRYIAFSDILSIGEHAITVAGDSLPDGNQEPEVGTPASRLTGIPVMTTEGNNVGTIEDIVFADKGGELLGYEISSGLVGDLVSGRYVLTTDAVVTWGEDAVIVKHCQETRGESDAVSHL